MPPEPGGSPRRDLAWALLVSCLLLGFFHRFAPASVADTVAVDLDVSAAALGLMFSWHFWVYTVAQVPAGVLVDRYGPRRCVLAGTLVTAGGSLVLAAAGSVATAARGPGLTGAGLALVFIGVMKDNAHRFRPERYGLVTGLTMLLATIGAIVAGAPVVAMLERFDWRLLYAGAALAGVVLSVAVALLVRDVAASRRTTPAPTDRPVEPRGRLRTAMTQRALWPLLLATLGTNGTFYAFAGLWGVPLLVESRGLSPSSAVWYVTASMSVSCAGCLLVGVWSDRVGRRKPFLVATSAVAVAAWTALAVLPWQPGWQAVTLHALVGAAASQVTVSFALLKESVPPRVSATALAVVNAGVFAGSAALQPLVGAVVDTGLGWGRALGLMVVAAVVGLVAAARTTDVVHGRALTA